MDQASEASRKQVPRFASFRQRKRSSPQDETSNALRYDSIHCELNVKNKNLQSCQPNDKERRLREPQQKAERRQSSFINRSTSFFNEAEPRGDAFILDRTGDSGNLIFGTLGRYSTPSYSRIGAGNIIGSSLALKIDRALSNEKGLVLSAQNSTERCVTHPLRHGSQQNSQELRVKKEADSEGACGRALDYLPLGSVLPARRKRGDNARRSSPSSSEEERTSFGAKTGSAVEQRNDPDLEYMGNESSTVTDRSAMFDSSFRRRRLELTRRTDSEPHNVKAWLGNIPRLVQNANAFNLKTMRDFFERVLLTLNGQKLIHHHSEPLGPRSTGAERRSTADIKMSLYEKALHKVKDAEGRQMLLIQMMEEAPNIWDTKRLSAQWSQVLKTNPDSLGLWMGYLNFKQTAFPSFTYEVVHNVFLDCLLILREAAVQRPNNSLEHKNIYENQVFVILRMTFFMRESGFLEHAIAAWQAILEYEFFTPPPYALPHEQAYDSARQGKMIAFEQFWESEVARIGEEGAKGWASFSENRGQSHTQGKKVVDHVTPYDTSLFSTWIAMERTHILQSRQPARTNDDTVENDPYCMTMFSDIRPFLIDSPCMGSRNALLDAFLIFCQLPVFGGDRIGSTWYRLGIFRSEALYLDHKVPNSNQVADSCRHQGIEKELSHLRSSELIPFDHVHSNLELDSEILFAKSRAWFSAFDSWRDIKNRSQSPIEPTWVLNALKALLASEVADAQLAEYVLALELCLCPINATRTARNLLRKQTSNLRLYNAYALIEFRLGNSSKAENVLATAINMSKDLASVAKQDCILLWRTWIWQLLNERTSGEAFSRLQTYGDPLVQPMPRNGLEQSPLNPTRMFRTENALIGFREHMIDLRSPQNTAYAMECLILFEYLKNTSTLSAATAAFTANLRLLSINFAGNESSEASLRQSFARLLHHHATHEHLFKPSDIRVLLTESVTRFPQNTIFLSLYMWNETRFRLDDRVRSIIQDVVLGIHDFKEAGTDNVLSQFFAIHAELNRGVSLGSNDNAIRATFERAIESRSGGHCAGIWRMYFLFEHSRRDLKKATAVFHRGIRACPWVKELYLLPFDYLRDGAGAMREADLRGVYDLMVLKELRVHVDLEALIEQRGE